MNQKHHIKKVILGLSYHNICEANHNRIIDPSMEQYYYKRYMGILDKEAINKVKVNNLSFITSFLKYKTGISFDGLFEKKIDTLVELPFIGEYNELTSSNLEESIERIDRFYLGKEYSYQGISNEEVDCFHKIVELCKKKNISLVVYNSPIFDKERYYPNALIEEYNNLLKHKNNYQIIDFSDYPLKKNCFYDFRHLNKDGALIISKEINQIVNKKYCPK